ncbi:hypothetical protein VAR608DRAFT_1528 [Variovorax sp. HW608]|uniref:hypothetical protein n=1 Tax=Variovorax sp. HW608 TaxID=1034889 RepID=UPI00081FB234|nr:hypothetical protein [Variovorax sp. HW608]SCK20583.1 hypothetical protein VAR608DRAFT_1528 [Variovorax sp. HW608]
MRSVNQFKMFAQPIRIRRLSAKVLLVWLFALAMGIVNACVIAPQSMPAAGTMGSTAAVQPTPGDHNGGCPECPDEDSTGISQGSCAKFCVDESSSVPTAKQAFDPWPALGIAVVPTMALAVVDPEPRVHDRPDGAPPLQARISIPIAYLRLTL